MRTSILGASALLLLLTACTTSTPSSDTKQTGATMQVKTAQIALTKTPDRGPSLVTVVAPDGWALESSSRAPAVRQHNGTQVIPPVILRSL